MPRQSGADPIALHSEQVSRSATYGLALVTFLAVWVPMLVWSFATPPYGSPDENDHVRFAAAVVRAADITQVPQSDDDWDARLITELASRGITRDDLLAESWGVVTLPAFYGQADFACFAFQPDNPAGCQVLDDVTGEQRMVLATRFYPKLYYAVVGLPSLVLDGRAALYAMRALSAAVCAVFCAFALLAARRTARSATVLGVVTAITPVVWFLGGTVNPNAVEITAALATWAGLVTLLDQPRPTAGIATGTAIAAATLGVIRPVSMLWLAVIAVVVVIGTPGQRLAAVLRERSIRMATIGVALVVGLQTVLTMANGSLSGVDPRTAQHVDGWSALRTVIGRQGAMAEQLIGQLGWLDTKLPFLVVLGWFAIVAALATLAVLHGERRQLVALGALVVACVALPVFLELRAVSSVGFFWQGRYTLPIAVGVPVLAARAIGPALGTTGRSRTLARALVTVTTAGTILALYTSLRRYSVGMSGPVAFWDGAAWNPPATPLALLVAGIISHSVTGWWFLRLAGGTGRVPAAVDYMM